MSKKATIFTHNEVELRPERKDLENKPGLLKSTGFVAIALIIGYAISFIKASVVAAYLGAGWQMDLFLWAYAVIDWFTLVISGPLDGVLIPIYTSIKTRDEREALDFVSAVLGLLTSLLLIFALIIILAAPQITNSLLGIEHIGPQIDLAVILIWVMAPKIVFLGIWTVYRAVLNAEKSFFLPALLNSTQAL